MACVPLPTPPAPPALPAGISLSPPSLPPFPGNPNSCCKLLDIPAAGSILPLPPLVWNPGVAAALAVIMGAVEAFLDAQPFRCPKE